MKFMKPRTLDQSRDACPPAGGAEPSVGAPTAFITTTPAPDQSANTERLAHQPRRAAEPRPVRPSVARKNRVVHRAGQADFRKPSSKETALQFQEARMLLRRTCGSPAMIVEIGNRKIFLHELWLRADKPAGWSQDSRRLEHARSRGHGERWVSRNPSTDGVGTSAP